MTAVTRTDQAALTRARVNENIAELRERNAMVAQIRGTQWGLGIMGLDPVRHVEVLGGRIYLTAEFYQERGAKLIREGLVDPSRRRPRSSTATSKPPRRR
jgi:hypothetical protein